MIDDDERKRLIANARANEAYETLYRIRQLRKRLKFVIDCHDASFEQRAKKCDCAAFWKRIDELALRDEITTEAARE